jgi:hypothetical protein
MSVTFFAQNLIESAATISVQPPANSGYPLGRIDDRDRGPQYKGGLQDWWAMPVIFPLVLAIKTPTQTVIDIDLGSSQTVSGWGMVNTSIAVAITLTGDDVFPPTTTRDTKNPGGADFLDTFAGVTKRRWRITIPAVTVAIGELLLGVPRVVTLNPYVTKAGVGTVGNVARDRSRAGYLWSAQRGPARDRLVWGWLALSLADLTTVQGAFSDCAQGAKKVLVQDPAGTLRWMDWLDDVLAPVPADSDTYALDIHLEGAA